MNNKNKGSVYIMVVIVLSIVLMLLSMLLSVAAKDVSTSNSYSDGIKAYYIAQSGISKGLVYSKGDPKTSKSYTTEENIFSTQYSKYHSMKWKVVYDNLSNRYTITSVGQYASSNSLTAKRILEVIVHINNGSVVIDSWKQVNNE